MAEAVKDASSLYEVERRAHYGARPGFRITELQISPKQKVPWHYHSNIQDTFYVIEGRLRIFMQNPKEEVRLDKQGIASLDWDSYPILRFSEVPEITADLVSGGGNPALGVGECSVGPTAAAVGNAVAHALGVRICDMPFTRERIMTALLKRA